MEHDQEKHTAYTKIDMTIRLTHKKAPALIPFWWELKVPDIPDARLRLFQKKSLNNWHFIYMVDTEWSSMLIDSCLFANNSDVENMSLTEEIYLLDHKK